MRTIYIKEKRTGNFEFSTKKEATHTFKTKKEFEKYFYQMYSFGRAMIKATYRLSQTYYTKYEFDLVWSKAKNIYS